MEGSMYAIPEDCLIDIISRTSPPDACNFSATSTCFRLLADTNAVWQSFIPSDCESILARAVDSVVFVSKKDLFFKLSTCHVLIDKGTMSFGLDRLSGAKCYMLSTSMLEIAFAGPPHDSYWRQISLPDSRFADAAEPIAACWLNIIGKINTKSLSPRTRYGAYLVYKLTETSSYSFHSVGKVRQRASVFVGKYISRNKIFLEPLYDKYVRKFLSEWKIPYEDDALSSKAEITAMERGDGWLEVELGEYYNDNGEYGEMVMELHEVDGHHWVGGLIVQGIEIRPKH